jgi:hypothetical protein
VNKLNPIAIYIPNKVKSKEAGAIKMTPTQLKKATRLAWVTNLD